MDWPVSVWICDQCRFYNGRSVNVSYCGAMITLDDNGVMTYLIKGMEVEVNFPRTATLARQKGGWSRIKAGKIIWVKETATSTIIGVEFDEKNNDPK